MEERPVLVKLFPVVSSSICNLQGILDEKVKCEGHSRPHKV